MRVSAPAAVEDFFEDKAAAEVGQAQDGKAAEIHAHRALPAPAFPEAPGQQYAEHEPGDQRQGEFVRKVLFDEIRDERGSGSYSQSSSLLSGNHEPTRSVTDRL